MKKLLSVILSLALVFGSLAFTPSKEAKAADENILGAHNRANYTWMTSNANNGNEGFCGVDSGFSAINAVNENLTNGNNILGTTATTDEVAIYVNLGNDYDITSMKLYQGSTNANYTDSYCKNFSFYYSTDVVNSTNKGAITWAKAGECTTGTIYSTAQIKHAEDVSSTGDEIVFAESHNARSIKVVFDKDSCMGTGTSGNNTGTVGTTSILSLRVYGSEHQEESTEAPTETQTETTTQETTSEVETVINSDGDDTLYGSGTTNLTQSGWGYASSNQRQNKTTPVKVNGLTDKNEAISSYIVTHIDNHSPWFAVDLRSAQDVNKIRIVPGGGTGTSTTSYLESYPTNYEIQVARENVGVGDSQLDRIANFTWTTVKTITDGTLDAREITFPHQTTRWLRIKVNSYNTDYCALRELGVYATDKTAPYEEPTTSSEVTTTSSETPTESTTAPQETTIQNSDGDDTLYGSGTTNLSQSKNGYASSNDRQDKNYAVKVGNLTDGNDNSFIVTHSQDANPWFAVDLGSVQDINKIKVVPCGTDKYANSYPISYEIQVSPQIPALGDDAASVANLTWTTVKTVTNGSSVAKEVTFPHQTTRWVRVKVNTHASDYCSLFELYTYATDKSKEYVEPEEPEEPTDILFIGNSMTYYNTICKVVEGLANHKGKNIRCTAVTNGGQNLIYQSTASNVDTAIKVGGYEIVILQDIVSSFNAANLQTGAEACIEKIKTYNPDAQIVFYEPFPRKSAISNPGSRLPEFTSSYIKTATRTNARMAPAGEAFYDIYTNYGLDYYCTADSLHPQPLGTFVNASTILYTLFPDLADVEYTSADQEFLDNLINTNIDYTDEGRQSSYDLSVLNLLDGKGYYYAHAVATAMASNQKYTSIAGEYDDPEETWNPDGLSPVSGTVVDSSLFTSANGDIAIGKTSSATSGTASLGNDGNAGNRWESTHGVDPQVYTIDFGAPTSFNTVGFIWEGAYAKQYVIQVSDDGENWTTVQYVTANSAKTVQIDLGQTYTKQYVRMAGFSRGSSYGYSFYEMGVWNIVTEEYDITIDGETVETVEEGDTFTIPSTYEYGYIDNNDNSKVYKPGTEVTVTADLSLTAIKTVNVESKRNGASIRLMKSNPGIAFEASAGINGDKPVFSSAFTYGMVIAPEDAYYTTLGEQLVPTTDKSITADVKITSEEDFYDADEGIFKCGIMKMKDYNINRRFLSRAYVTIKYTDGSSRQIYSDQNSLTRSLAGVAYTITQTPAAYNALPEDQKDACDYFASLYE